MFLCTCLIHTLWLWVRSGQQRWVAEIMNVTEKMFLHGSGWGFKHSNTHQQWLRDWKILTHSNTDHEANIPGCSLKPGMAGGSLQKWAMEGQHYWTVGMIGCMEHWWALTSASFHVVMFPLGNVHRKKVAFNLDLCYLKTQMKNWKKKWIIIPFPFFSF